MDILQFTLGQYPFPEISNKTNVKKIDSIIPSKKSQ